MSRAYVLLAAAVGLLGAGCANSGGTPPLSEGNGSSSSGSGASSDSAPHDPSGSHAVVSSGSGTASSEGFSSGTSHPDASSGSGGSGSSASASSSATAGATSAASASQGASSASASSGQGTASSTGPLAVCGDGVTQAPEECDDGNATDTDACRNTCRLNWCGDGVQDLTPGIGGAPAEACDDGNLSDRDGCVRDCQPARCGDGLVRSQAERVEDFEECDDGAANGPTGACTSACLSVRCGDALVQAGVEECDDGNAVNTDGCTSACRINVCGDGHRNPAHEQCDLGSANGSMHCDIACALVPARVLEVEPNNTPTTSNLLGLSVGGALDTATDVDHFSIMVAVPSHLTVRVLDETGACPTGFDPRVRVLNGDGALVASMDNEPALPPSACPWMTPANTPQVRGLAAGMYTVVVDTLSGRPVSAYHLAITVTPNACGDGYPGGTEQCDDGNLVDTDGCSATCRTVCGDGVVLGAEQCDDGNLINGDGCSSACLAEYQPEVESNDTVATANLLLAGRPGFAATGGSTYDVDHFAVDVPEGYSLLAEVLLNCSAVYRLDVLSPAGAQLASASPYSGCAAVRPSESSGVASLPAGRYIIRVTSYGGTAAAYRLRVALLAPACGNGVVDTMEECDQGNLVAGDGCSATCTLEGAWTREREPNAFPVAGSATPLLDGTLGAVGRLGSPTDVDHFTFQVPSTGVHQVARLQLSDGLGGCPGPAVVSLRSEAGLTLAETTNCTAMTPATHPGLAALVPGSRNYVVVYPVYGQTLPRPYAVYVSVVPATCGDRAVQEPEECDDGNITGGDGCAPNCRVEGAFTREVEPNDYPLPGYSTPLAAGDVAFIGAASAPGERDVYSFTVPTSGPHNLDANLEAPDGSCPFPANLELLDDQGTGVPLAVDQGYAYRCPRVQPLRHDGAVALRPGATYHLRVTHTGSEVRRWVYVVNFSLTPVVCGDARQDLPEECEDGAQVDGDGCDAMCRFEGAWQREVEPNDDYVIANLLVAGRLGFVGRLQGSADVDQFRFRVPNGTSVNLAAQISNGRGGCGLSLALTLLTGSGGAVAYHTPGGPLGCPSIDAATNAAVEGLAPGEYVLQVRSSSYVSTGEGTLPYALSIVLRPPVCGNAVVEGGEECDDGNMVSGDGCAACAFEAMHTPEVEPNGSAATATPLAADASGKGSAAPGDQDFWRIQVTQPGMTLVADVTNGMGGCPVHQAGLVLSSAQGLTLAAAPASVDGCAHINGSIPAATNLAVGAYDLMVMGGGPYGPGTFLPSYVLSWSLVPPSCGDGVLQAGEECDDGNTLDGDMCSSTCVSTLLLETEPNGTAATANALGSAVGVRAALTPTGDLDFFAFTLTRTASIRAYTAGVTGTGCPGDTLLELRNEAGQILVSDDDDGEGLCSLINGVGGLDVGASMLAPGNYFLMAKAYSAGVLPSYGVFLQVQ